MDKLQVYGKANLNGSIEIPGAKNAVLPIMACSILTNKNLHLTNMDLKEWKRIEGIDQYNRKRH